MSIMTEEVSISLEKIYKTTSPISIFIYGSRARTDYKPTSDYEVGALYLRDKRPRRSEIATLHNVAGMNVYPFVAEDLEQYNLDTPFPIAIYLRELIGSSKTVFGTQVLEKMELPEVKLTDLLERAAFDVATAFAAVRSFRTNDLINTAINFKSAMFGARVLEIYRLKKLPYTYDEIFEAAGELGLTAEYIAMLDHAMKARNGNKIDELFLFTNITFLNQEILQKIRKDIRENGDRTILTGKKLK